MHRSRAHDVVIRVYDAAGNATRRTYTPGDFKGTMNALAVLPSFPANFPFAAIVGD